MENLFGITQEDIDKFQTKDSAAEVTQEDLRRMVLDMADNLTKIIRDPAWLERAKLIARLPGLSDQIKISAILLGAGSILSQLLLLHLPAKGTITARQGMQAFSMYGEMIGMSSSEISEWVALYFNLGIIEQVTPGVSGMDIQAGPLSALISVATYPRMEGLWATLLILKDKLEKDLGLEFVNDQSLRIIPVENLAPDK